MTYKFDIDEWLPRFPLQEEYGRYSGSLVTSPCDICNNEHLRWEMQDQYRWGPAVPVDVFIMADGEPDDRSVTKIGGVPYRAASESWPLRENGKPMLFLAQFNFSDSRDLYPNLHGDVLLVFTDDLEAGPDSLHMEWQPLGLSNLIAPTHVPPHPDCFSPCYGAVCRTVSFPEAIRTVDEEEQTYPECRGKEVWSDYWLLQFQATQIGQAPFYIQVGDADLPGRPLCTISSVCPDQHKPYPWLNQAEPLMPEGEFDLNDRYLTIGDTGCIYISIDVDDRLRWGWSCY